MENLSGDIMDRSLSEVVRTIYLARGTGVLQVSGAEGAPRRFHFVEGELHLPSSNPLAAQIGSLLEHGRVTEGLRELLTRIASLIDGLKGGVFSFSAQGGEDDEGGLVGPLPTAELVMLSATQGRAEASLVEQLGGERARLVCTAQPEVLERSPRIDADEVLLLSRLAEPRVLGQILEEVQLGRREALEHLCRLRAVGLVETVRDRQESGELASDAVLRRFSERIARQLEAKPLGLDAAAHRRKLAALLGDLGELNHYQLLGVEATASVDAIHEAYERVGRLAHPSQAEAIGLSGKDEGMRVLFERATEAYLVLTDPLRRSRYDRDAGVGAAAPGPGSGEQTRALARNYYQRAQELVEEEDYHYALELLQQAVHADPRVEYLTLLAEVQSKNPKWLQRAAESYRQALQLAPENLEVRAALGQTFVRLDDPARAMGVFRSILIRDPDHPEAREEMSRLKRELAGKEPRKGLLRRLFGG